MDEVVDGTEAGDGGAAGAAGMHAAGDFLEAEAAALEHDQGLNFGVFQGEGTAEDL